MIAERRILSGHPPNGLYYTRACRLQKGFQGISLVIPFWSQVCIVKSSCRLQRFLQRISLEVFPGQIALTISETSIFSADTHQLKLGKKKTLAPDVEFGWWMPCVAPNWPRGGSSWLLIDSTCPIHLHLEISFSFLINGVSWGPGPASETIFSRKWTFIASAPASLA